MPVFVFCAVLGVVHARTFLPFMADDAFISLRYADRLLAGKGLTWTDFEKVEGYSNLLWILVVAGLSKLMGLDLVASARITGTATMLGSVAALLWTFRPQSWTASLSVAAGALVVVLSGPAAVWAIGGLEQPLATCFLAIGLGGTIRWVRERAGPRPWLVPGIALGLLCLTRPDGVLLAGAIALASFAGRPTRASWRFVFGLMSLPIACVVAQLLFRLGYYGDWVPNTAHAKISFTRERLQSGLAYLTAGFRAMPVLAVALLIGSIAFVRGRRAEALLVLVPFVSWCGYVLLIGGDIFPAYRHLVVLLAMSAFLMVLGLEVLTSLRYGFVIGGTSAAVTGLLAFLLPHRDPEVERARTEGWEWDGDRVGKTMAKAFGERQPLLAADPSGSLPYFSRLPSIDMLGLNDRYLARHPPPDLGRGYLGHELGNGPYVLARQPDLVVFCEPLGSRDPCYRGGQELVGLAGWKESYRLIRLETLPPERQEALIWVRTGGRLGVSHSADEIRIPGIVMSALGPLLNRLADDGRLKTVVPRGQVAASPSLTLEAGSYQVSVRADASMLLQIRSEHRTLVNEGFDRLRFSLPRPARVDLEAVAPPGQDRALEEVVVGRE